MTKKETNLSGTLSEAVSVATSVAYTRQEIQKLKTELVSLLEKKTTELIVEQIPGPVGPRGALGASGAQGPKGDKGDKGDDGERGEKGEIGPQGNMGLDGPRGLKGDKGDKGEQGQVGPQGEQGIQGLAGERGPQGLKGDRGEDGKNGLDGKDGQAGAIGPVGPAGSQGVQGGQGPKGDKGERGRDGQQGVAGPAGPQGEIGPQGIQGVAGKDGKDGDVKPVEEKFQKFIENVQKDVSAFKTKVNAAILKGGPNDAWKATGSGEVNLRYLDDIDRDSITDGYVLSYDSANAKFKFVEQGGGDGTDQWARDQANAAYNYANTLALESGTLDTTARTTANSAWYTANLAYVTANSAWATANSALNQQSGDIDPFARSQANSAFNQANLSYIVANNSWSTANASYIQANTGTALAQAAYDYANTLITGESAGTDNLARSIANSAFATANAAYNYANTIVVPSLSGYAVNTTVNLIWSTANSAYTQANLAFNTANSAWTTANTQSDWNQTSNTAVDYIKNKPTIPDITPIQDALAVTGEPMGHADKSQSVITFNDATRTFTIAPANASFDVWVTGTKQTYTTPQSVTIANTSGEYYVYFDSNGLGVQTDYFIWDQQAPTSLIYYNANTGTAPYFADERHGTTLDWQTHEYLHRTRGAVIANGFSIGNYSVGGAVQIDIGNGTFFDEDLQIDVIHSNTPTANTWQQDLQGPAQIPMFYLSGTGWVRDNPTGYVNKQGASRPRYNLLSGGTWSVADIDNNKYGTTFIVATNNLTYPIIGIMSQSSHANQGDAEGLEFSDLVLTGFPVAEFRLLYKVVFKADSLHGTLTSVWDLRQLSATTPSAAIGSDHGLLSGLGDDDHPQYLLRTDATAITSNVTSAFNQANSATTLAQAAYNFANTIVSDTQIDPFARSQANSAFNQANTATSNAATANSIAVSAFAQANAGVAQASSALLRAIDANTLATNAFSRANTAYAQANTATTLAQSAYDYANTIVVPSLSGYATNTTVNLVWSTANNAYAQANTGLAKNYTLNTVTSNTSIANTDSRELFLCDTSNNVVLTMPAGNTVGDGFNFKVTRLGSGEVTLAGAYGDNVIRGIKFGDINFNFNTVYDEPLSAYENILLDGEYKTSQLALSSFDNQTSFELVSINNTEYALVQGTVLPSGTQDFAIEDYNDLINTPDLSVYATTSVTNTISIDIVSAWSTANSAFNQANTATTNAATANNQAASAFSQANSALSIAQSAFAQANTGGADNVARSIANSAFSTANSAFAKANTGTSQLVNDASTVSLSANGNLTVPGPIIGLGNSKLDFTTYGSNTAYLTTTDDDATALFMGLTDLNLYAHTTVQIRTNTTGVSNNWTFGADGTLTFPDNTVQTTAATNIDELARSISNSAFSKANTAITTSGGTVTGNVVITYQPVTTVGQGLTINGANTQGGTGYADFLKVTNTSGGATNPNKTFRLNSTGSIEVINSAYNATLMTLSDTGAMSTALPYQVAGKQAVNGPAFSAYAAAILQTIPNAALTKVLFQTEEFDTNSNYASSRFTPTVEGYYQLNAEVRLDGASGTGEMMIMLYKNGAGYKRGTNQQGTQIAANFWAMQVSTIVYANGTGDYFEIYVQQGSGGSVSVTAVDSPSITWFNGCMLRGA